MSGFVLDSSIALSWCFGEERTPALDALEARSAVEPVVVPALWYFAVANVLLIGTRKGRISPTQRDTLLAGFRTQPITVDTDSVLAAMQTSAHLADTHRLTVYDAAYLELAIRRSLPLATLDGDLRRAAVSVGLEVLGT